MTKPTVYLMDYQSKWKEQFKFERDNILDAIGDKIAAIEHIGSTSIEGIKAKPIIDIMVGVEDLSTTENLISPLSEIEFEYIPKPELTDRRFFRKGEWGKGTCHLHICEIQSTEWAEKLWFRNYLREHPKVAESYTLLKSELATKYKYDRSTYTQKKEPFIKNIIELAKGER
ncbi:hypothetical protein BTS2_2514 [Bacillus sp. TS-2]|nr:hypothetical protein BTS2_2514 [Bacillus sp. TS-2]